MEVSVDKKATAWQPLTPRGVAAFSRARWGRLLLVQFIAALLAAAAAAWFLREAWFPVIKEAIVHLPQGGEIRRGELTWSGDSPVRLAEDRWLALTVDSKHEGTAHSPAHFEIEFGRNDARIYSLFGFLQVRYSNRWNLAFNRSELEPWWGAWARPLLAMAAALVIGGLMFSWTVLATLYFLPAWLAGLYTNRDLSLRGSWRLAGAALMPGALLLTAAIVLYGLAVLDLIELAVAAALHLVVGCAYVCAATLSLPRHPEAVEKGNPFVGQR